jgi:diguanylate cyclase (GGDEF)-like protein
MSFHWSVHQLTEYLSEVSGQQDESQAMAVAAERAAEALDAEVAAVLIAGEVQARVGFGAQDPPKGLFSVARVGGTIAVPEIGVLHTCAADLGRYVAGALVAARLDEPLAPEEVQMLHGMAQMLGLALRGLRTLEAERILREEREREAQQRLALLEEVSNRQRLVETLLGIQRTISSRKPLHDIFHTITSGASGLVDDWSVALILIDPLRDDPPIITSRNGRRACDDVAIRVAAATAMTANQLIHQSCTGKDEEVPEAAIIAAPVLVDGQIVGSLVAELPAAMGSAPEYRDLITAFAQQVSLALADARAMEAMHEAFHDPLTGLANRALLLELLEQALEKPDPASSGVTVVYIDLDGFKAVNDSYGHETGDDLLRLVADRISRCLRSEDTAARLGGDEFVILLEDAVPAVGVEVAERIITALKEPFLIADREVFVAASAGVAQQPKGTDAAEVLSAGDVAMYQAKQQGRNRVVVFEPAMRVALRARMELHRELRRAAGFQEFAVEYQPIVQLDDGKPVGMEALVRWHHPARGRIAPSDFIPIAEETGIIRDLGRWVMEESARQTGVWRGSMPELRLNVNVSARQIGSRRFSAEVAEILARTGLPGSCVTVELTETALMFDPQAAHTQLAELRDLGIQISVDDFGTGYSSLSYLRKFPLDEVKIDRSFVMHMDRSPDDLTLVRAVIDLARSLRLRTVAEGIENAHQLETLRQLGCHLGQGYHLARPMEPSAAQAYFVRAATGAL